MWPSVAGAPHGKRRRAGGSVRLRPLMHAFMMRHPRLGQVGDPRGDHVSRHQLSAISAMLKRPVVEVLGEARLAGARAAALLGLSRCAGELDEKHLRTVNVTGATCSACQSLPCSGGRLLARTSTIKPKLNRWRAYIANSSECAAATRQQLRGASFPKFSLSAGHQALTTQACTSGAGGYVRAPWLTSR